mgnify:CR=1 FL=1
MGELTREEEEAIAEFARSRCSRSDPAHGWDHVLCVVRLARLIGREVRADMRVLIPAAYLHDVVSRRESPRGHSRASAEEAFRFLLSIGFSEEEAERVRRVIESASYEAHLVGVEPDCPEAVALREADMLDAMGARGIARAFSFAAFYGSPIGELSWDPESPPDLEMSLGGPDPSAIHHFASKLLRLRSLFRTETGRRLAEGRHRFMVEFLKRYRREVEGLD